MDNKNLMYLAMSVPVLYFLIGLDAWFAKTKLGKKKTLGFFIDNVKISMGQQVLNAFAQVMIGLIYIWVYKHFSIFNLQINFTTVVLGFLIIDFNTYWFHRASHRFNFLWANHVIHHSGEEFGLSVSVRHPWFSSLLLAFPLYLLAVVGIPPALFFPIATAFYIFQFFSHADSIPKLGWIEKIFVTPSHHRAHHAKNACYIDKNFGAVLIIWDKIFGTFEEEVEEPQYGLTHAQDIRNTLWENIYSYVFLFRTSCNLGSFKKRIEFLFKAPGELESFLKKEKLDHIYSEVVAVDRHFRKFELNLNPILYYSCFILTFVTTITYMVVHHQVSVGVQILLGLTVMIFSTLLPNKPMAIQAEVEA